MSEGNPAGANHTAALGDNEVVARALFTPEWDENVKRGSPGCFKRNNTSVTRHKGLTMEEVIAYLKGDVESPGKNVVVRAVGLITVRDVKEIGVAYQDPVHFEVLEKPTAKNPAHAEVTPYLDAERTKLKPGDLSRGLSRQISQSLDIYLLTPEGEVIERSPPQR
ncbi:hypothetical protein MKZ87_13850 [Pseudomonas sp. MCal1]|uniref:hypothetical protein n=1 Tax=Pseudomonas sp. MCal1 TaxID=2919887 RepID=UPI00225A0309|nr:hypothetical protein [Pseudomonas sp. MCal1]MCX4218723.1 hypothetical protein [Pseudomonas sp. MCal1]